MMSKKYMTLIIGLLLGCYLPAAEPLAKEWPTHPTLLPLHTAYATAQKEFNKHIPIRGLRQLVMIYCSGEMVGYTSFTKSDIQATVQDKSKSYGTNTRLLLSTTPQNMPFFVTIQGPRANMALKRVDFDVVTSGRNRIPFTINLTDTMVPEAIASFGNFQSITIHPKNFRSSEDHIRSSRNWRIHLEGGKILDIMLYQSADSQDNMLLYNVYAPNTIEELERIVPTSESDILASPPPSSSSSSSASPAASAPAPIRTSAPRTFITVAQSPAAEDSIPMASGSLTMLDATPSVPTHPAMVGGSRSQNYAWQDDLPPAAPAPDDGGCCQIL